MNATSAGEWSPARLAAGWATAVRELAAARADDPSGLTRLAARDAARLGLAFEAPEEPSALGRYARTRASVVLLGTGVAVVSLFGGATYLVASLALLVTGHDWSAQMVGIALGTMLLYVGWQCTGTALAVERSVFRRYLNVSELARLSRRIDDLAASRAAVVAAVDDERRRIERDLHDGVQQRLVGLGMLLGRAQRAGSAGRSRELIAQAHEESQALIQQLREVSWRVYPAELDHDGLGPALTNLALRTPLPVTVDGADVDLPVPLRTAVFFLVSEALTNAVKHARAERAEVSVRIVGDTVLVHVIDDGIGGADPTGSGLSGLARRVTALDGRVRVSSPTGGPTVIEAVLPCG